MKSEVKKISQSQLELKIEVPAEEFEKIINQSTLDLGKNLEVKGFRKGKIPREIIEKQLKVGEILKAAAERTVQIYYPKAILENKIEAISRPEIEILKLAKGNPFEFKAKVWVLPEVELPNYKKIISQLKKREIKVTEEEIKRLKKEKERHEKERLRQEILEKLAQKTKTEIPSLLIEEEKKRMLENLKKGVSQTLQISFEEYLDKLKKTEKELLDSFSVEAQNRIKKSLVLREIGKKEKISVSEEEIKKEIEKFKQAAPGAPKNLDQNNLRDYTKEVLKNEKIFQLLESFTPK